MAIAASVADNLELMLDVVWQHLDRGVADRAAAMHQPVVATMDATGPAARVMVLRAADRTRHTLRFHTDRRAGKVAAMTLDPRVAIVAYDAETRVQLRLGGRAAELDAAASEAIWSGIDSLGRRSYRTTAAPGSLLPVAGSGLPDNVASTPLGELGRENFMALEITLDSIEWLLLAHSGHRRAQHNRDGDVWHGCWLVP